MLRKSVSPKSVEVPPDKNQSVDAEFEFDLVKTSV